ncbi:D-inositol 3-phosphate glycosyltransferase 1 [Morella rubra]|uniref:D-inositol 3-phosphate glycosyltransferase 1 n=1 Tax=Morella rubra TaxID=262757 RepID=A0A6A1WT13_9ROSI|nr:D-inositol 3-phosphate glycosyltransferase 1 [Morella rubra]KAB1225930.1 D-inositol 3-phosphate glycosyltransferase 1 [Morella rubra]
MAKTPTRNISSFRSLCKVFFISVLSFMSAFYWCQYSRPCYSHYQIEKEENNQPINLLTFPSAWNHLTFSSNPPPKLLKIALFVKKWPHRSHAGGLERHALTLHYALAKRGHETHIFTASASKSSLPVVPDRNLYFHLSNASAAGYLDQVSIWKQFQTENSTGRPFDVVHTESVALRHRLSRYVKNLAVSWHGIEYETIHSDILREIFRTPEEEPAKPLSERAMRVAEEVKFFPSYAHHVATSDHAGDILKRIYMIPEERVHIILNGVDEAVFKHEVSKGEEFRRKLDIPDSKSLVLGMAGRLVRDKGYPLMFEALTQMFKENATFRETSVVLVAGDGPWAARYRNLGGNVRVLGPLDQTQLKMFYNAIDIFVNPTLRAQGLDHTLLEATLSGKPLMATRLASITGSVIVGTKIGYTFSPTVTSLKGALYRAWIDGREVWEQKGHAALQRGLMLFTANKMASAYERLFLCISNNIYCQHQTPFNSNGIKF